MACHIKVRSIGHTGLLRARAKASSSEKIMTTVRSPNDSFEIPVQQDKLIDRSHHRLELVL